MRYNAKEIHGDGEEFNISKLCQAYGHLKETRSYFESVIRTKLYKGEFDKAEIVILLAKIKDEIDALYNIGMEKDRETFTEYINAMEYDPED